jgi:CRISPR-associated endonuclease Csn1
LQLPYKKKQNLLVKKYKNNDWNARALNDTRYITKYLKNHIENTLIFAGEDINIDYGTQEKTKESKQRVIVTNGITTAYLRKRWGLSKDRDESNLHHAMDATIVATVSPTLIKKITSFSKSREVMKYLQVHKQIDGLDPETGVVYDSETIELSKQMIVNYNQKTYKHFPEPWEGFANETRTRLNPKIADADEMRRYLKDKPGYAFSDMAFVKPVFVSRMPKRGVTGQAHKETLRSPRFFLQGQNKSSIRVQLTSLKQKDLENILGESKESVLYKELQARFAEYGDKAEVAFKEPIYRKDKAGNNVNIVRSIKVVDNSQNSGYVINQDKALVDNGGMSRVDIFTKDVEGRKKYYTVPVYSHQIAQKELPVRILPVPKKVGFINVDESFIFCFSVYPNDLLKIVGEAGDVTFGYYVKYNISSAGYSFIGHADTSRKDIDLISKSIGNAKIVEKYQVDVLGNYTKVKKEVRLGRIIKNKK